MTRVLYRYVRILTMPNALGRAGIMKKCFIALIAVCAVASAQEGQSVAVYVSGIEPDSALGVRKTLGGELAKAVSEGGKYSAIDRTTTIPGLLSKERPLHQSNDTLSGEQITVLGPLVKRTILVRCRDKCH
jgi:hypothetical protein